jgi:SOS-response transcriptional repressor LexA
MPHLITSESDMARNSVRVWMRQVLAENGWSAAEWARRAGIAPTTLTRILDPVSNQVPSTETVTRLSRVAGSQPNLGSFEPVGSRAVPLYLYGDAMGSVCGHVLAAQPVSEDAYAVRLTTDILNQAGILPGDIVIVEPTDRVAPMNGKIVLAEDEMGDQVVGRVMTPWLMPASTGKHEPRLLEDLQIMGVVVAMNRQL